MVEVLRPSGTVVAKSPSTVDSALYAEQHLKSTNVAFGGTPGTYPIVPGRLRPRSRIAGTSADENNKLIIIIPR